MKKNLFAAIIMMVALMVNAQEVQHITKAEFLKKVWNYEKNPEEFKYEGKLPCIVDFYATWCGPCKRLAPILEEVQKEYAGKIIIYKVDTGVERELAAYFGIQSIPTVLWCPKNGKPLMTKGLLPKENIIQIIEAELLKKKDKNDSEK